MHERKINNKQKTINYLLSPFITYYLLFIARCAKPVGGLFKDLVKLTVLYKLVFDSFLSVDKLGGFANSFALYIHNLAHTLKSLFLSVGGLVLPTIHSTYKYDNKFIKLNYLLLIRSCA